MERNASKWMPGRCFGIRSAAALVVLLSLLSGGAAVAGGDDGKVGAGESAAGGFLRPDGTLDVPAVVAHFENLYRSGSSIGVARLIVNRRKRTRRLTMKVWTKGTTRSLIVILAPPREEGTATLRVGKNLWYYLPRIRRTIRIPPSMMLASWMGSDFTNDDLVRESSFLHDYTYRLAGPSESPAGWVIRFTAREGVVGLWWRFDLVVSRDGTIPIHSDWYDRKGRLARTIDWDQVRVMDGRRIPTRMILVPKDVDEPGRKTVLIYDELDFDATVPDDVFSLTFLERRR